MRPSTLVASVLFALSATAASAAESTQQVTQSLLPDITAWRRDLHQHPELSNREQRTSKFVAAELKKFGYDVRTGIAHTGVVGVLKGGKPGPKLAIRADMDALPVTEPAGLPFASTAKGEYLGKTVGVMHACGHDAHTRDDARRRRSVVEDAQGSSGRSHVHLPARRRRAHRPARKAARR